MVNVGMIGLGSIGLPISKHIAYAYDFHFFARKDNVIKEASQYGTYHNTIKDLSKNCEIIILFVSDYNQCNTCIEQMDLKITKYVVIGSTISPLEIKQLQNDYSTIIIDAPVSGGVKGAIEASLTTMISGKKNDVSTVIPIIKTYSKKIVIVDDEIGKAEALKAIVQLMVGINTVATCEALTLADKLKLDPQLVYETVLNSSGYSKIFENRGQSIITKDYHKRGNMSTMRKDLNIISELSKQTGLSLSLTNTATTLFNEAKNTISDELDFCAIVKLYQKGEK